MLTETWFGFIFDCDCEMFQHCKRHSKNEAKGFMTKSGRKYRSVLILLDSRATITLVHSKIVKRLWLKINERGGDKFNLYDPQGASMVIEGMAMIYVVP